MKIYDASQVADLITRFLEKVDESHCWKLVSLRGRTSVSDNNISNREREKIIAAFAVRETYSD